MLWDALGCLVDVENLLSSALMAFNGLESASNGLGESHLLSFA